MRKKKNNRWLVALIIVILVAVLVILIGFSNRSGVNTKLNLSEKKWIENNKKEVINVSIANNIPAFSSNGEGVFFSFVSKLEEDTGLSFNLISYDAFSDTEENDLYFEVVKRKDVDELTDDDMVFLRDYYVLVSKESKKITDPTNIKDKKIGVITDDLSDVSNYVSTQDGITYSTYQDANELTTALKDGNVDYIAVPKTRYL